MDTMDKYKTSLELFIKETYNVMTQNLDSSALHNANTLNECIEFINDIIDISLALIPRDRGLNSLKNCMQRYLIYNVMPAIVFSNSFYVCTAILQGAIPQAAFSLRLVLESIALAVYADYAYPTETIAEKLLQKDVKSFNIRKYIGTFEKMFKEAFNIDELVEMFTSCLDYSYQILSNYIHPIARIRLSRGLEYRGLLLSVMENVAKHGFPPSYSFLIPSEYLPEDQEELTRLSFAISMTRVSIASLVAAWINTVCTHREVIDVERIEDVLKRALDDYISKYLEPIADANTRYGAT